MKKYRYVIGKVLLIFLFVITTLSSIKSQTTLYTYKSGTWNDLDTWTTDPGGTTLVGSEIPKNGDNVVILMSRTVTLTSNIDTANLDIKINSGGILDIGTYTFTSGLAALRGEGKFKLASANFPNVTGVNPFTEAEGGTVVFYNSTDFDLPDIDYNNLTLDLNTVSVTATQLSDITLNGNLYIKKGSYKINNGAANRWQLIISGNVTVDSGSSISVGTGSTASTTNPIDGSANVTGGTAPYLNYYDLNTHRIVIYGDFTNNGVVNFTNQSYPVYDEFPTNGAATVYFLGSTDNTLTCNDTTDFYNLVIDKGTDQTYQLSVNSSEYRYFRLFGANVSGGENGGDNPDLKKALWIRNGTFRLFGKVVIPSLSEGTCPGGDPNSDFYIPANAAFVIDGPDVILLTTADSYNEINAAYGTSGPSNVAMGVNSAADCSSLSILGKFQMDDGYVSTRESGGFIYWASSSGEIIINGGILDAKQFRTAGSSGGLMAYRQTGGTFNLRGRIKNDISGITGASAVSDLALVPLSATQSTDGIESAVGTFNVDRDDNIFEMTGGTIKIYDVCGESGITRAFEVNSLPAYYSVSGGTVEIIPTNGSRSNQNYYVASSAPIYNLTIDDSNASGTFNVILTNIPSKAGVTLRANPPLTVSNDLTFLNNATLNAAGYEVQVGGDFSLPSGSTYTPNSNWTTFNGSSYQTFTGGGTITSGFYNLKIDKSADTLIFAGTPTSYTIQDTLHLIEGTMDDGGDTLYVAGDIYNAGVHTGTGRIVLNGTGTQYLEQSVFGTATFGNLELNNETNPGAQLISDFTTNTLTLNANIGSRSIFSLQEYRLTLTGGVVQSIGTLAFGDDKMVRTSGAISAKGLKVNISLTGASSPDYLFPIGVLDGANNEYNPYILLTPGDPGTTTGTINVVPVNSYHPTVKSTTDVIKFYWKVNSSGFAGANAAGFQYYFVYFGTIDANQNKAAYLDYESVDGWVTDQGTANKFTSEITFNAGLGFLSTDFTAGKQAAFNKPRILYSRASTDWHLASTWSETAFGGAIAAKAPEVYDRFIIGGAVGVNHTVSINSSLSTIAGVEIYSNAATGISGTPPTLNNPAGTSGINVTSVSGGGRYIQNDNDLPDGDFGDFCNNDTAIFEYSTGIYDIPAEITFYPNLHITSNATDRVKTLPNNSILVKGDLILSTALTGNTLRFNSAGGNLTVYGDIALDNESSLEFDGGTAQNLNVYGNLNLDYDNTGTDANNIDINTGTAAHQINFYGDSIITGASVISLANGTLNILDSLNTVITDGTGSITLNQLVIDKNNLTDSVLISENFTLNGTTNSSPKALTLSNGTLILENTSTNVELSSGGAFYIPQTSALILKDGASVNVIGSNAGIFLDGLLSADSTSVIDLGDGSTTDTRYIEYSGSGNAEIILSESAVLSVNSQIRRSLSQTNGVLKFNQSGSATTTIYGRGGSATRAKFEIVNSGSEFDMTGGTFTIIRGGGTTYGDLYLRPASGSATGGTITLGSVDVGGMQTIKFDSEVALNTLVLDGVGSMNTFQLMVNPLVMNGDLTINTVNSNLYANGINVTLMGDLTNNGTYTPGTNTTTFNGGVQTILGSTVTDFYNLVCQPADSLTFNYDVTVANDLSISTGSKLSSDTYDIFVGGDVVNNGIHSGDAANGGIILNGTEEQNISGTGTYGRLNLYNPNGARILNNITLNQDLYLSNGVLNINQYLLTLGYNSDIVDTTGTGYSSTKMIEPNGVFSDVGIKKNFTSGAKTFTFPIGVSGKYTPADLEITANSSSGFIRVNCINDYHPTVVDETEVLQYFWEVESSGISAFDGELKLKYVDSDVAGTESDYVAARLVIPDGTTWSKASTGPTTDNVDEINDTIKFSFNGVNNISGEFTAGSDAAIPATVPTYTSNSNGNWDDVNIWTPIAPAGGPNGFIVVISPGDSVYTNGNRRFAYRTTINGVLDVRSTYGHNLGTVIGTGKLRIEGPILPAGRFTSFLSCSGGILEYSGNTGDVIIADRLDTLRCLYFTGTGTWTLPDKDLVICDTLRISGATLDNSADERNLTINGSFQRINSGSFISGGGDATIIFAGNSTQTLGGADGEFTGSNKFNNFEINNSSGLILNSPLEINGTLELTDGVITTTTTNLLKMLNGNLTTGAVIPDGGSVNSYVDGPMSKRIFGGNNFYFPVGDGSRYGKMQLIGVQDGTWQGQYFDAAYGDLTTSPVTFNVSSTEYWKVTSPSNGLTATVELRWDPYSDITPLTVSGGSGDIRVAEYTGAAWIEKASTVTDADNYNGTIKTSAAVTINTTTDPQFYTLGAVSSILAKAYFTTLDDVCAGGSIPVSFSGVTSGEYDFTLYYTDGTTPDSVNISSMTYSLPAPVAGTYQLTGFKYNSKANTGVVDGSTVTVNAVPAQPTIDPADGDPSLTFCSGGSVILTSSAGTTYLWSTGATTQNISAIISGNYTVQITNAAGCLSIASAPKTVTVNPLPVITVSAIPGTICFGETSSLTATGGGTYLWSPSGDLDFNNIASPVYDPSITGTNPTSPTQITTTFSVTVTNAGCSDTGTVNVVVKRAPETGPEYHIGNTWGN